MKKLLLRKLSLIILGLGLAYNGYSQMLCTASYTYNNIGNGTYIFTSTSTGGSPATSQINWFVNYSYVGSGDSMSYVFPSNGTYGVCVSISDSLSSCFDSLCSVITVTGVSNTVSGCHAYFNVNATNNNNEELFTIGSGNALFDSSLVSSIHWDFGDGQTADGTLSNGSGPYAGSVMNTYAASGFYNVCLTLTDSTTGCTDTYCNNIWIGNVTPTCNANFVLWQDSTNAGTWYAYNYSNTTNNSATYLWDFGDGFTSTQQYPTHTYTTAGHYNICLTVTDSLISCTSTYCDTSSAHKTSSTASMMSFTVLAPTSISKNTEVLSAVGVYPNPVTENTVMSITSEENTSVMYTIYNMYGQAVANQKAAISKGKNIVSLNTTELANGIYYVNVIDNTNKKVSTIKIVK